jgi:hypothetical protein
MARHVKNVPGPNQDRTCWTVGGLEKRHGFGLLMGCFRPDQQIRKLRAFEKHS